MRGLCCIEWLESNLILYLLQLEQETSGKWFIINEAKYRSEKEKYRELKKSLGKRAEKQSEIRDNTAAELNIHFSR